MRLLREHALWLLLFIATLFCWYWLYRHKTRLRITNWQAPVISVLHTLVGVLCVKVFAFLETGSLEGQSLYGAVFFMPLLYYAGAKITKRKLTDVIDIFAIAMIFTLLCARVDCIISGCCKGLQMPWSTTLSWPTREAELLFYLVILFWLGKKIQKAGFSGRIYPLYMVSYGTFRFIVEWFREADWKIGIFHISHIWSIISVVIGAAIYFEQREHETRKSKRRKQK